MRTLAGQPNPETLGKAGKKPVHPEDFDGTY
jgi:hypothetical protein